jgi:hypothetical protein
MLLPDIAPFPLDGKFLKLAPAAPGDPRELLIVSCAYWVNLPQNYSRSALIFPYWKLEIQNFKRLTIGQTFDFPS